MRLHPRHYSLRTKLVLLAFVILGGVAIFLLLFFPPRMERMLRRWVELETKGMVLVLAKAVEPGLEFEDPESVNELLRAFGSRPGASYAVLLGADGVAIGGWEGGRAPRLGVRASAEPQVIERNGQIHALVAVTAGEHRGDLMIGVSLAELEAEVRQNTAVVAGVSISLFVVGLILSFLVGTYMVRPIRKMTDLALRMAQGDLSQASIALDQADEVGQIGDAFDTMADAQRQLVKRIRDTSARITGAATEIDAAAREQDAAGTEQSTAAEEVSQTMHSLLDAAGHIAESAQGVLVNAERTRETTDLTAGKIADLTNHANRIAEILEVIRDIADRSDLLALNAALEATRAGEAGRSFSLVAAEMRRLAERVTGSVEDVKALVGDVRASGAATVVATEENRKLAEGTTSSVRQITLVTQQQRSATEQVSQSMRDIARVISQSAAANRQTQASVEGLRKEAESLSNTVGQYKL